MRRPSARLFARLHHGWIVVAALLTVVATLPLQAGQAAGDEARRITWLTAAEVASPAAVRRVLSSAVSDGISVIIAPVLLDPGTAGADATGLADLLRAAHDKGLQVRASLQAGLVNDARELPASRDHVVYQHPEWLMVPRELGPELWSMDPRSPDYIGRLSRWTRANARRVDGLYLSPLSPQAAGLMAAAATALLRSHRFDAVDIGTALFPGSDFDYSRSALELFRREARLTIDGALRAQLDQNELIDPFAYAEALPEEWQRFRQSRLTALVARLRTAIRSARPDLHVSASVVGDAELAMAEHFQDWRTWLDNGLIDALLTRSGAQGQLHASYAALLKAPVRDASSESR